MPVSTSLFLKSIKPVLINSRILQEQIFVGITSGKMFKKLRKKKLYRGSKFKMYKTVKSTK